MVTQKIIKEFNNLDEFPDLKNAIVPNFKTLPFGSIITKLIINKGEVVERVYKKPNGEIISLFPSPINEKAA